MDKHDPTERKTALLKEIAEVEAKAPDLEAMGQELAREARRAKDTMKFEREIITRVPADKNLPIKTWYQATDQLREWNASVDKLLASRSDVRSFVAQNVSTMAAVSTGAAEVIQIPGLSAQDREALQLFTVRFHESVDRPAIVGEAHAAIQRLDLHVRSNVYRPVSTILDEALGAIERPVAGEGGPASILLALRECIDAAVTELVRRRPRQEPAKTFADKILSLGGQCGLAGLSPGHFDRLADNGQKTLDLLSAGKQRALSRERLSELFNDGLLYLKGLLESFDPTRLHPP